MRHDTLVRLIAAGVILVCLIAAGVLNPMIAASVGRYDLTYADTAEEGDPPQVALGIAMGAFRGLFVNILWIRANELKEAGKYHEAIELARAITKLQPRFPQVWAFHAWNMAYNISVTTQTPEERWQWVNAGIDLLRDEGLQANPNDMLLHKELAWIYLHKIGGYTDDANQFYKRKVAEEWTVVLGEPPSMRPPPLSEGGSAVLDVEAERERVIKLFADRFNPIIDAPETLAGLRERNPAAADLAKAYEHELGEPVGFGLLARYTYQTELDARRGGVSLRGLGAKGQAFAQLLHDPKWKNAWDDLIAHTRKRVLIDKYKMEPLRMQRLVQAFGPIDWRMAPSHALYWASRGVEVGRMEVDEHNSQSFDFINTYRVMMQSIQELARYGDLYFNFLDWAETGHARYQPMPNMYFIEAYGDILEEANHQVGVFGDDRRAVKAFSAGYGNFLRQAVLYYYRRGPRYRPLAEKWYQVLRTSKQQDIGTDWMKEQVAGTLEEFAAQETYERWDSPYVAVNQITAALQSAFTEGLLAGDQDLYAGMMEFARQAHAHYMQSQLRSVAADPGVARMEYLDEDFRLVVGGVLAAVISTLSLDDAEQLYQQISQVEGEGVLRFAYDPMRERFGALFAGDKGVDAQGRTFDQVFPEPKGMDQFRAWLNQELAKRQARENQGMEHK
ncbi:MAG: hypothetical protein R3B57_02010 [Phycisphaerales bacterium]